MHAIGSGDRETLEAVVGEAAARLSSHSSHLAQPPRVPAAAPPWLGADGLVPCDDAAAEVDARRKRARLVGEDGRVCASQGSAAPGRRESTLLTLDPCGTGADDVCGFTTTTNNSTSLDHGSPEETENTSFGGGASDSRCFSRRSQASKTFHLTRFKHVISHARTYVDPACLDPYGLADFFVCFHLIAACICWDTKGRRAV
jgi:hypothetical protein